MGMAIFLGFMGFLLLATGAPHGGKPLLFHYGMAALMIAGCFLAWALERGFL